MGYYVTGEGEFTIRPQDEAAALKALHDLNWRNDLKHGGRWPQAEGIKDGPREDMWFSWMPWNYHETTDSVDEVLELLGFDIYDRDSSGYRRVTYNNKIGAEEHFFAALAPFITEGQVYWNGEDDRYWQWQFPYKSIEMKHLRGRIIYEQV